MAENDVLKDGVVAHEDATWVHDMSGTTAAPRVGLHNAFYALVPRVHQQLLVEPQLVMPKGRMSLEEERVL